MVTRGTSSAAIIFSSFVFFSIVKLYLQTFDVAQYISVVITIAKNNHYFTYADHKKLNYNQQRQQ